MKLYNLGTSQIGFVELHSVGDTIELDAAGLADAKSNNGAFLLTQEQWDEIGFTESEIAQFGWPGNRAFTEAEEAADTDKQQFMRKYRNALTLAHQEDK